jgi:hypothetical protein
MDDDYLQAVLEYGGADWHLDIIRKEIKYREDDKRPDGAVVDKDV